MFADHRTLELETGDITKLPADAIVNAANAQLAGGGGVDGAIHRAGGPSLMRELDVIRAAQRGCPTGNAVVTGAGDLPARFVFHAVGPVWHGGNQGEPELLASCYRTCMELAKARGVRTISFPSISTGIYGYPVDDAAEVAVTTLATILQTGPGSVETVRLVLFNEPTRKAYEAALTRYTER